MVSQVLTGAVGFIGARALGPAGKGQVTAVLAWAQILVFVFLMGLSFALSVRAAESEGRDLGVVLGNATAFAIVVSVIVGITSSVILSHALRDLGPQTGALIGWAMLGGCMTMAADLFGAVHMALGHHRRYSAFRLALPVVMTLSTVPLWLMGDLTAAWVVAGFVAGALLSLITVCGGLPWRTITFDLATLVIDVRYGLRSHVASLLGAANVRLDLLIMSLFLSATSVGLYGLANSTMVVLTAVPSVGGLLLLRSVAWGTSSDAGAQLALIRRGARKYLLMSAAVGVVLFVSAPLLVHSLLGARYAPSVRLIQILVPGYVARSYLALMTMGAIGVRRPWIGNLAEGVALIVTIGLLILLLPRYGATGAAITSTFAYVTAASVGCLALHRAQRTSSLGGPTRPTVEFQPVDVAESTVL